MRYLSKLKSINWRLVGIAISIVGILHILATLAIPELTPARAYDRLAGELPLNSMQILPPVTPTSQRLPFMAPDARYAVCRFDATDGAVALTASLPGPGWMLALYSAEGDNVFASVAQPGRRTDVSLLLVPAEERTLGGAPDAQAADADTGETLRVTAQSGLAIIRAPDQGQAYAPRNLAELKRARCAFRKL